MATLDRLEEEVNAAKVERRELDKRIDRMGDALGSQIAKVLNDTGEIKIQAERMATMLEIHLANGKHHQPGSCSRLGEVGEELQKVSRRLYPAWFVGGIAALVGALLTIIGVLIKALK